MRIYIVLKSGLELGSPGPQSKALTTRPSGRSIIGPDLILQTLLNKLGDFFTFDFAVHKAKTFDFRRKNVVLERKKYKIKNVGQKKFFVT